MVLQVIVPIRNQDGENDPSPEFMQIIDRLARELTDHIGNVRVKSGDRCLEPWGERIDIGVP